MTLPTDANSGGEALPLPSPQLTDGVVSLRGWSESDLGWAAEATADPEIIKRNKLPQPFDPAAWLAAMPAERRRGEALRLLIADVDTDRLLGAISLSDFNRDRRTAVLGYWMVASARGRGVAGRGVGLICGWAFETIGLDRVTAETDADNLASRRMLEKAGFVLEGDRGREEVRYFLRRPGAG